MFYFSIGSDSAAAQIYLYGVLVKTVSLDTADERSFRLPEMPSVEFTLYPDKTIAFTASDCPDKVCIKTGRIGSPGQIAACVPNRMYIKIINTSEGSEPDIVICDYEKNRL